MTSLKNAVLIFALAYAGTLFAQQSPPHVEPLPSDPKERIYYGEYYDPEEYAKCWEKWVKTSAGLKVYKAVEVEGYLTNLGGKLGEITKKGFPT